MSPNTPTPARVLALVAALDALVAGVRATGDQKLFDALAVELRDAEELLADKAAERADGKTLPGDPLLEFPPVFYRGDIVQVNATAYDERARGLFGQVLRFHGSGSATLDGDDVYTVRLSTGHHAKFWGAELDLVRSHRQQVLPASTVETLRTAHDWLSGLLGPAPLPGEQWQGERCRELATLVRRIEGELGG